MKNKCLAAAVLVAAVLSMPACGQTAGPDDAQPVSQEPQTIAAPEASAPEYTLSGTMLLDGNEIPVFLTASENGIDFRTGGSGENRIAVAWYPDGLTTAEKTMTSCDFTDLDGDGNSDPTAFFTLGDGSTASVVWFFSDGEFVYNDEFSRFPGDGPDA